MYTITIDGILVGVVLTAIGGVIALLAFAVALSRRW